MVKRFDIGLAKNQEEVDIIRKRNGAYVLYKDYKDLENKNLKLMELINRYDEGLSKAMIEICRGCDGFNVTGACPCSSVNNVEAYKDEISNSLKTLETEKEKC